MSRNFFAAKGFSGYNYLFSFLLNEIGAILLVELDMIKQRLGHTDVCCRIR